MEPDFSPMVRRLRVARELKELREARKITLQQAGDQLDWSRGRVSRLERAEIKPEPGMVMDLLDLYRVTGERYDELVTLARQASRDGWWNRHNTTGPGQRVFADLEAGAQSLKVFNSVCVPGLLQTAEYAETRIRAGQDFDPEPIDVAANVALRLKRHENRRRLILHTILDESVLLRRLCSPEIRYQQIEALIEYAQHATTTIQILSFDQRVKNDVAAMSPFTVFEYPPPDPPMVMFDTTIGRVTQEVDDEPVKAHLLLYDRLADAALSPDKSIAMMEALLDDI